ncbi:MAG: hypothetical protein HY609_02360 [Deltaproteobacteria bacterium]|nr:hypothetical protein [Deltaproteobacteria bacterium]MBI4223751.1 hypothetical protein [Deltaproteobacteria bacterium]
MGKIILGFFAFDRDAAAFLLRDGEMVAAAREDWFSRRRRDSRFPFHAINYCLEEAFIHPGDLDEIVCYGRPSLSVEDLFKKYFKSLGRMNKILAGENPPPLLQAGGPWGPKYGSAEIAAFLDRYQYPYERIDDPKAKAERIGQAVAGGKSVGLFSGRMPFGTDPPGGRSILGDLKNPKAHLPFHGPDEPLVCAPWDAYRCFLRMGLDLLVLENFLLWKDEQPKYE